MKDDKRENKTDWNPGTHTSKPLIIECHTPIIPHMRKPHSRPSSDSIDFRKRGILFVVTFLACVYKYLSTY